MFETETWGTSNAGRRRIVVSAMIAFVFTDCTMMPFSIPDTYDRSDSN